MTRARNNLELTPAHNYDHNTAQVTKRQTNTTKHTKQQRQHRHGWMDLLKREYRRSVALIASLDQRAHAQAARLDDKLRAAAADDSRWDALETAKEIRFLRANACAEVDFLAKSVEATQRRVDHEIARLKEQQWDGQKVVTREASASLDDLAQELEGLVGDTEDLLEVEEPVEEETPSTVEEHVNGNVISTDSPITQEPETPNSPATPIAEADIVEPAVDEAPIQPVEHVDPALRRRSARILAHNLDSIEPEPEANVLTTPEIETPEITTPVSNRSLRRSTRLRTEEPTGESMSKSASEDSNLADRELALLDKLEKLGASPEVFTNFMEFYKLTELAAVEQLEKIRTKKDLARVTRAIVVEPAKPAESKQHNSNHTPAPVESPKIDTPVPASRPLRRSTRGQTVENTQLATPPPQEPIVEPKQPVPERRESSRVRSAQAAKPIPVQPPAKPSLKRKQETAPAPAPKKEKAASNPKAKTNSAQQRKAEKTAAEELYCVCQRGSFGRMIACDNTVDCPHEWYHLTCLGLKYVPKGTWYCPTCVKKQAKKKSRSK